MNENARRYLANRLEAARDRPTIRVESWVMQTLASFGGALESLLAVESISVDEHREWMARMHTALSPDRPVAVVLPDSRIARGTYSGNTGLLQQPASATFLRMIPVANADRSLPFGGRIQILGVERYDSLVGVNWRLAPPPNVDEAYAAELAEVELEIEGLPDAEQADRRFDARRRLEHRSGRGVGLSDDVGTEYRQNGGNSGGGSNERVGRTRFSPGVPDEASRLTVHWDELEFEIDLSEGSTANL